MLCFVQPPEPNTHLFRLQLMHYKVNIFDSVIDDITAKKQSEWSRVQSNVQGLIMCRLLSQLKISTWYTELQLYEKFQQVLKIFQPRLKYGVIHIARTPKGEGTGQSNAYDCVQGRGGSNYGNFCVYELCDDVYNNFEKYNIQKANEMKEQNKKNKNAFENK